MQVQQPVCRIWEFLDDLMAEAEEHTQQPDGVVVDTRVLSTNSQSIYFLWENVKPLVVEEHTQQPGGVVVDTRVLGTNSQRIYFLWENVQPLVVAFFRHLINIHTKPLTECLQRDNISLGTFIPTIRISGRTTVECLDVGAFMQG